MTIYRKYTEWGNRINIGKGEAYCPRCNGRGCVYNPSAGRIKIPCGFCRGHGKVDWIQIAINEPTIQSYPQAYINYIKNNFFEEYAALWLAKDIDKEIMNSLITFGMEPVNTFFKVMKVYAKIVKVVVVTGKQGMNMI